MIQYIKYTVDGVQYTLTNNNGVWERSARAPSIAGRYDIAIEISQDGVVHTIDNNNSSYNMYLDVISEVNSVVNLTEYLPTHLREVLELKVICNIEENMLDVCYFNLQDLVSDAFISTASPAQISRLENFLNIIPLGTLQQRKNYILSLYKGTMKINEDAIKGIVYSVAQANCRVSFYGADDPLNPIPGGGVVDIKILSPENEDAIRFDDIARSIVTRLPCHLQAKIVRFYSTWRDIETNFGSWSQVQQSSTWRAVHDYLPPN